LCRSFIAIRDVEVFRLLTAPWASYELPGRAETTQKVP
jgi:hypothetical protein